MEITREQKALAAQVMLPMTPLPSTPGRCPAWIEPDSAECKLPAVEGLLCGRHHREAQKKLAALRNTLPHPWKQDPMTDHTLTETTEFTDEVVLALLNAWTGRELPTLDRYDHLIQVAARRALTAALAADDRHWEPLNGRPLRVGDEVRQDCGGISRFAVVAILDNDGDPWTAEGTLIGALEDGTWYFRRPAARELPTKPKAVIVANDGHEHIEATHMGQTYHAREAVLIGWGLWQGAWSADGDVQYYMTPSNITLDTWKEDDR